MKLYPCLGALLIGLVIFVVRIDGAISDDQSSTQTEPKKVSLVELIVRPKDFNRMKVSVFGVFVNDATVDWLYLNRELARVIDSSSAIYLSRENRTAHWREEWDGRLMMVEGTFVFSEERNSKGLISITNMRPTREPNEKGQPK